MLAEKETHFSPDQTIQNLRSVASYIVVMRNLAKSRLNESPYLPDLEELSIAHLNEHCRDFMTRPREFKDPIVEQGQYIFSIMKARALEQTQYESNPDLYKRRIVHSIRRDMGIEVIEIEFDNMEIAWGLFSFGVVLPKPEYEKLYKLHFKHPSHGVSGYVTGQLEGPLGLVPVICKGPDIQRTIDHEDLHVLQQHMGLLDRKFDLNAMIQTPEVERALLQKDIQHGDLDKSLEFVDAVAAEIKHDIVVELQTNAWDGNYVSSNIIDKNSFGDVDAALTAVINACFDPSSGLDENQKLRTIFESQKKLNDVNYERFVLMQCLKEAKQTYKGHLPKDQWLAALTLVFNQYTSIKAIKAVMLGGRNKELEKMPKRFISYDLAGAISSYARRTIMPETFGMGEIIPESKFNEYANLVAETFLNSAEVNQIIRDHQITEEKLELAQRLVIEYVKKSALPGKRAKLGKLIKERFA